MARQADLSLADSGTQTDLHGTRGRHILVIKLGALGDVILALPHLERILEAHTADRVVLLTAPSYAELVSAIPGLEVVAFPRKGFIAMFRLLFWLLRQSFDAVYDLQGSARSRVMTLLTQADRRVGVRPGIAYTDTPPPQAGPAHAVERLNALLASGGLAPAAALPRLPVPESAMRKIDAWLLQEGLQGRRLVLVHPGSSTRWPSKRWEEGHFRELGQRLMRRGFTVIWIGDGAETDLNRLVGIPGV